MSGTVVFWMLLLACSHVQAVQGDSDVQVGNELNEMGPDAADEVDEFARLYVNRCTGCHTIGRGPLTGPDLEKAMTWPDSELWTGIKRMEEKSGPMTDSEVDGLLRFLKDSGVHSRISSEEERLSMQFAAKLEPSSSAEGSRLFFGRKSFSEGGLSCVACHKANGGSGGTLGPDLAGIFSRMGESGLRSACQNTQFKVMGPAYKSHPISNQEAAHLTAYFKSIDGSPLEEDGLRADVIGMSLGLILFLSTGFLTRLFYRNRSSRIKSVGRFQS